MIDINSLKAINISNRIGEIERREQSAKGPVADFEGSVTGYWIKLDDNAGGVVEYNGKEYVTKPLGWTSILPGTPVKLTSASGIYYSQW